MHWKQHFIKRSVNSNQIYLYFWFVNHRSVVNHTYAYGGNRLARLGHD